MVLAGFVGCTDALAARTTLPVKGDVAALALAGDAVIVARQRADGSLRVERLTPGAPAQTLLRLPPARNDYFVSLAASTQALAVTVGAGISRDTAAAHVFVGPSAGPLREVAACQDIFVLPPVAVSGSRVAWSDGGCFERPDEPRAVTPLELVLGDADPARPPRRLPVAFEAFAAAIVLHGERGLVGLIRPSFFAFLRAEVRTLGAAGIGDTFTRQDGELVAPVGILPNGDTVLWRGDLEEDDSENPSKTCLSRLFVIAAGSGQRRPLSLGGCPFEDRSPIAGGGSRTAGDRVFSIVRRPSADNGDGSPVSLNSVRGDGAGARLIARGSYRSPLGLATDDAGRVAWWHERCAGGSQIVVDDGTPAKADAIRSCRLTVLTRSTRVNGRRITVRLRCPSGCSGQLRVDRSDAVRRARAFAFEPGTHRLTVRLTRRERRAKRLVLRFEVTAGRSRQATVRLP